jgi:hypothetical protein
MELAAARTAKSPPPSGFAIAAAPLAAGFSSDTAATVMRARRFGQGLHVSRASRRAVAELRADAPQLGSGCRLGLVLATDRGDQHALARRMAAFARQRGRSEPAPPDLFRAIAYFPVGRVAQSVAEDLQAEGPVATVPADIERARSLAHVWLAAGRADQVVIVEAEATSRGDSARASAELWLSGGQPGSTPPLAISDHVERIDIDGTATCAGLVGEVIDALAPGDGGRTALIVCSLLADAGESLYAGLSRRDPGPPFTPTVTSLGSRLGFAEVFLLVGSSGAGLTALALAQDLVALGRADRVVACGVDLVDGAMATALGMLHCDDLPHLRGGATGLLLARAAAWRGPAVSVCGLAGPRVPRQRGVSADLTGVPSRLVDADPPAHIVLSGLTAVDLACAEQLAGHVWPGVAISGRGDVRGVSADALRLAATAGARGRPMGIVAAHALGGSGCCLVT